MSRSQAYRPRIPPHIIQILDVASRITLFLVGQAGSLCFTFKDRLDNQFKTSIGTELQCSCAPQIKDHCIHTMYILLRIFKVKMENPILWQAAYLDSELSDLVSGKHTAQAVRKPQPTFDRAERVERAERIEREQMELPSDYLKRKEAKKQELAVIIAERMKLNEESVCPICQQDMREDMCLTFCKVECGNNFHLECLKIWAKHRLQSQESSSVNCPMCRAQFPSTLMQELQSEQKIYAKQQNDKIKIEFNCSSCGLHNIPNNPHKCLLCTGFQLCECCYVRGKHIKHPFIRRNQDGQWRGANERRQKELKIKQQIQSKRREIYNEQVMQKIRKMQQDPGKLMDFITSSYPFVSNYINEHIDPLKKMDFDPSDIKCFQCGSMRMLFLRRLSCGHFVDNDCLKQLIASEKYFCQTCGSQFLKGYENLKQKEREIQRKKNQHMINLNSQFQSNNYVRQKQEFYLSGQEEQTVQTLPELNQREFESQNEVEIERRNLIEKLMRQGQQINSRKRQGERLPPLPNKTPQTRVRNVANINSSKVSVERHVSTSTRLSSQKKSIQNAVEKRMTALLNSKIK